MERVTVYGCVDIGRTEKHAGHAPMLSVTLHVGAIMAYSRSLKNLARRLLHHSHKSASATP